MINNETFNILNKCNNLSDAAIKIFGKENYNNRQKIKKLSKNIGFDINVYKERKKKYCLCCSKLLTNTQKKFCSSSCAAKINNQKRKKYRYCLYCGKLLINFQKKFCSNKCQCEFEYKKHIYNWKNKNEIGVIGDYGIAKFIRRYMFEKHNNKCQLCGWKEINPHTNNIPLQIHHIDGNCLNNDEDNLQLLCPNCHSLTETFGSLNKNATRKDKRKRR